MRLPSTQKLGSAQPSIEKTGHRATNLDIRTCALGMFVFLSIALVLRRRPHQPSIHGTPDYVHRNAPTDLASVERRIARQTRHAPIRVSPNRESSVRSALLALSWTSDSRPATRGFRLICAKIPRACPGESQVVRLHAGSGPSPEPRSRQRESFAPSCHPTGSEERTDPLSSSSTQQSPGQARGISPHIPHHKSPHPPPIEITPTSNSITPIAAAHEITNPTVSVRFHLLNSQLLFGNARATAVRSAATQSRPHDLQSYALRPLSSTSLLRASICFRA